MIPALLSGIKAIGGMGLKKAATQGAKGIVKGKAKDFITGKGRKKKTDAKVGKKKEKGSSYSNPGQIVVAGPTGIVPSTPMVGELSTEVKSTQSTPKKVSIESLTLQLENIVGLTKTLETITEKSYKTQKKLVRKARTQKEKDKKREREEKRESLFGKAGKGALGVAKKIGDKFNILNFFTQILLGSLVLAIVNNLPKIEAAFKWIGGNLHQVFLGFKLLLHTFKAVKKGLFKVFTGLPKKIFSTTTKAISGTFKAVGNLFLKVFKGMGNLAVRLAKKVLGIKNVARVGNAAGRVGGAIRRVGGAIDRGKGFIKDTAKALNPFDTRTKDLGKTSKGLDKLTGSGSKGSRTLSKGLQSIRAKHGDEAARMYQGLVDNGVKPQRALQNVNKAISSGKLASVPMKGSLSGGIKGSNILKGGANKSLNRGLLKTFGKNNKLVKGIVNSGGLLATKSGMSRIPIIGPLIVAVTTYFEDADGDGQPDKKLDKSLFKAGGALLGGFLGTFLPIPILGTILGELIGEYVGDLFYVLLRGGGPEALGNKLKEDVESVLQTGQKVLGWAGDGFGRMYEGLPKLKVPFVDFGIVNFPALMLNPLQIAPIMMKAFFSRDPMVPGEEKESDDTSNDKNQKIDRNYGIKVGDEVTFTTSTGMEVKAYKTTKGFDFYKKGIFGDQKIDFSDGKNSWIVNEFEQSQQSTKASTKSTGGEDEPVLPEGSPIHAEGEGLGGSVSKTFDFDPGKGDKSKKIFLHWTAGSHSTSYPAYHTTFLGSGKAVRATPYGQDKGSHTAGGNKNSVGLSIAAMGGAGVNENNFGSQPPTNAQLDAMTTEAAQLAYAWGWDASTVESNIRTHGEWERYATKNGIFDGAPQRWDLDKLKQSDPDIDVSKVLSSGGSKLRSMIKAKLAQLKSGKGSDEKKKPSQSEAVTPSQPEVERSSEVGEIIPIPKPKRSDFGKGRTGAKQYEKAMKSYNEQSKAEPQATKVEPQETKVPGTTDKSKQVMETYTGLDSESKQRSSGTTDTVEKPQPAEITSPPKPSVSSGVESQASYEGGGGHCCCCDDESVSVLPPPAEPVVSGGGSGGGGGSFSGGNVLNSLLKQQVLGFLYKQG